MTKKEFVGLKANDRIAVTDETNGRELTFVVIKTGINLPPCPHRVIAHKIRTPWGEKRYFCWCEHELRPFICSPDAECLAINLYTGRIQPRQK